MLTFHNILKFHYPVGLFVDISNTLWKDYIPMIYFTHKLLKDYMQRTNIVYCWNLWNSNNLIWKIMSALNRFRFQKPAAFGYVYLNNTRSWCNNWIQSFSLDEKSLFWCKELKCIRAMCVFIVYVFLLSSNGIRTTTVTLELDLQTASYTAAPSELLSSLPERKHLFYVQYVSCITYVKNTVAIKI